ncbi:leucine-rich repeat protein kinase family protein isoform X2 [Wolffia australiana]
MEEAGPRGPELVAEVEGIEEVAKNGEACSGSGREIEMPLLECSSLQGPGKGAVDGLYVFNNEFNLLPRSIWRFSQLKTLKFFGNGINVLPPEIGELRELERLQLKVSLPGFSNIPLRKLSALKELELSNVSARSSAFSTLTEITGLTSLRRLSINHLSIRFLPPEIGYLKKLEELDVSFNKLKSLPNDISELISLKLLKVSNNKLVDLPSGVSCLPRLEILDLSNNKLTSLRSLELFSMHSLHYLNLQHNRIGRCRVPPWICCYFDGNEKNISGDDSFCCSLTEMGMTDYAGCCHSGVSGTSLTPSDSHVFSRFNYLRRTKKKWRRTHHFQQIARTERSNHHRKFRGHECGESRTKKLAERLLHDNSLFSRKDFEMQTDVSKDKSSAKVSSFPKDKESLICHYSENEEEIDSLMISQGGNSSCITSGESSLTGISDGEPEVESSSNAPQKPNSQCRITSSLEESKVSVASKRHYDVNLDNPKRKCHKPFEGCSCLSCKYSSESYCGASDRMPDGFYDAGRDCVFMPLCDYNQRLSLDSREVIIVDREIDEELDVITLSAKHMLSRVRRSNFDDDLTRASILALFVSDFFGGSDRSYNTQWMRRSALGAPEQRPFVCTCSMGSEFKVNDSISFSDLCDKSLRKTKEVRNSAIVPIGAVRFGVCRHRAVLMKYLCDRVEPPIPCELVRGYLDFSPHAWNVVLVKTGSSSTRMLVDACHPADIREETDLEYYSRYIPLTRTYTPFSPEANNSVLGPISSLQLSSHGSSGETDRVMRCEYGSCTAAAKVRSLEIGGKLEEDVKMFEFGFLGEVRMLNALRNHKCIVEIYGHHLCSKWVASSVGEKPRQILQSAIIMEYVEGGSLKDYMKILSETGKKHVPADLALCIARSIACALVEVHSKEIIHRDVKSENVLIDLGPSKKSEPIVKLCDFDRAVPLYSFLHTCCISHLGVHPPDACVGTPCWMAPEVLSTIHKRSVYGLEVDIWSFGCLILELLTLKIPYEGLSESEVQECLQRKQRPQLPTWMEKFSSSDGLSSSELEIKVLRTLVNLFYKCTRGDPLDRPTARQVYDELCQVSPPVDEV